MILDFGSFVINESSLKKLKKDVHGVLNMSARKRMRRELRDNIITFKFKKRNGEIRTAHGTLHPDYLPPLKGGSPRPEKQMVYYDLDKEGWRSFRSYSFIKIINLKPVDSSSIAIKPHTKPSPKPIEKEEEDEKIKKTKPIEKEEEKEVKKPVPKKKETEDEEEHAYKSPIYDETKEEKKEREEDDEKIKKVEHKKEPEEKSEEDIDKDKEKEEEKKSEDE